tara:strand:+ start:1183 stop:1338 length:156 start_codon:yes stop_codon:yes gene_type:complete
MNDITKPSHEKTEKEDKKTSELYNSQYITVGTKIIRSLKDEKHPDHRSNRV